MCLKVLKNGAWIEYPLPPNPHSSLLSSLISQEAESLHKRTFAMWKNKIQNMYIFLDVLLVIRL